MEKGNVALSSADTSGNLSGPAFMQMKKLELEVQKLGSKIKHHEMNTELLKFQINDLDASIIDLRSNIQKLQTRNTESNSQVCEHAEQSTINQIRRQENSAAGLIYQMKSVNTSLSQDILGVVATLGRVHTDKLSRILSEFLGVEIMLAIVCKTYESVKIIEKYDAEGRIDTKTGLHGIGVIVGKPIKGRFIVLCLEDIRPFPGKLVYRDPQKSLDLVKPRLPSGELPPGFLGFAVNMISLDRKHLSFVTPGGHGLRDTLFYSLFSRLQVYRSRAEMESAKEYITHGAVSLDDGGIIRNTGVYLLGSKQEIQVTFPVCLLSSTTSSEIFESEEQLRLQIWEKERLVDDQRREDSILKGAKVVFDQKKEQLLHFVVQHQQPPLSNQGPSPKRVKNDMITPYKPAA